MCWGSQWAAAAPGAETDLAFFGCRGRKPTWLFLGALGRTTGFFLAPGEDFCGGNPTWLFGSPHRGFWGARRTLPQRFGAFTWCLHLVPSLGAFTWCLHLVPSYAHPADAMHSLLRAHTPTAHTPTAHTPTAHTPTALTPHSYHKHSYHKHSYRILPSPLPSPCR